MRMCALYFADDAMAVVRLLHPLNFGQGKCVHLKRNPGASRERLAQLALKRWERDRGR
ncbi:MAG: hypothetical protein ACJ790_06565 [Myxococcaceae bacterium]